MLDPSSFAADNEEIGSAFLGIKVVAWQKN